MAETIFGIDKGILKAFALMIIIVGSLTTFFLSEYISTVILGTVYYTALNGSSYSTTVVTGEQFSVLNATSGSTLLDHVDIHSGTMTIYNATNGTIITLTNFTIDYKLGNITTNNAVYNNTVLATNYTFGTETSGKIPISSAADTFLGNSEADFITTFGYVNTAIKFAAALITVVAVILIFAAFLPKKGKSDKTMGY